MKTRILIALCLVIVLGAAQLAVAARQMGQAEPEPTAAHAYLPAVISPATVDLTITRLETSQAIQTPGQTIPLVANRPSVVRVYLQAIADHPVNGVYVSFSAARAGVPLAGSPKIVGPVTAPLSPAQGVYTSTVNVSLPSSWLSGSVALAVVADPAEAIFETNESNNGVTTSLVFNSVPPLNLKIVPVNYTHSPTGKYFPAVYTDPVSDFMKRTYPLSAINVTYRTPPVDFMGNLLLASEWERLHDTITAIKYSDGAPASQVYYGLVPTQNAYGDTYYTFIGGIAWIGLRAAVGLDSVITVGAHEIGHTFGRLHAPCGNPAGVDPSYPYPGASIGNYGLDVYSNVLVNPGAPEYAKDLMSYCSPVWISDYTYLGLYNDQRLHGLAEAQMTLSQVLLIRAKFSHPEEAVLLPVYSLSGIPDEAVEVSDYAIEIFNQAGETINTYPVRLYESGEPDVPSLAIYAALPQPSQPISKIRLLRSGKVLAERPLNDRPLVQARLQALNPSQVTITLAWERAETPAVVRVSAGPRDQWVTLGVDVLGGSLPVDRSWLAGSELHFEVIPADTSTPMSQTLTLAGDGR